MLIFALLEARPIYADATLAVRPSPPLGCTLPIASSPQNLLARRSICERPSPPPCHRWRLIRRSWSGEWCSSAGASCSRSALFLAPWRAACTEQIKIKIKASPRPAASAKSPPPVDLELPCSICCNKIPLKNPFLKGICYTFSIVSNFTCAAARSLDPSATCSLIGCRTHGRFTLGALRTRREQTFKSGYRSAGEREKGEDRAASIA